MKRTRFLIPSLIAAGFSGHDSVAQIPGMGPRVMSDTEPSLFELFKQDHNVTLAQHRSHRSHSSHRSHTSHRSSTGGGYAPIRPVYTAPAPSPPPPPPPASSYPLRNAQPGEASPPRTLNLPVLNGRSERFKSVVRRVQIALLAQGLYDGAIDGVVGPRMRAAMRSFQKKRGLDVTGTITPELLDALRIASE
jgi:His-Xaa-Ser repeat protein HxsA